MAPVNFKDRMTSSQQKQVVRITRKWDGPAAPRKFVDARPKADRYVYVLMRQLLVIDADAGRAAETWYERNRDNLTVDQGSDWINRLKGKIGETPTAKTAERKRAYDTYDDVIDGNYALDLNRDKTHFYRVSRRERNGKVWLNVQERASDALFPVRSWPQRKAILDDIRRAGVDASLQMFSERLGRCWNCYQSLTDEDNPFKPYGLGPDCGPKVMGSI